MMTEQVPEIQEKPIQPEMVFEIPQNKNFFKIVLLVVLGLIVVAGAVYAGIQIGKKQVAGGLSTKATPTPIPQPTSIPTLIPTPDETANWKTYENSDLSFQLKYPADLVLKEKKVLDPVKLNFSIENDSLLINSSVYQMDILQLKDWVVEHGPNGKSGINYFPSAEKITSSTRGNYSTVEFDDYIPGQSTLIHSIAFSLNRKAYVFTLVKSADSGKLFDQILSTFKFLN